MVKKYTFLIIILISTLLLSGCKEEDIDFAGLNLSIVGEDGEDVTGEILFSKDGESIEDTGPRAEFNQLPTGSYELKVEHKDYESIYKTIDLYEETTKTIALERKNNDEEYTEKKKEKTEQESIKQDIISVGDTIEIEELKQDQKAIIALAPLDFIKDNKLDKTAQDLTTKMIDKEIGFGRLVTAKEYEFKEEKEFFVPELVKMSDDRDTLQANMVGRGKNIYVFNDNRMDLSLAKVDELVAEFDNNIYPSLTELFGNPPDVDNNQRVMVLLTEFDKQLTSGFFNPEDVHNIEGSNYHDLVYLNLAAGDENNLYAALARQFQHLLFHKNKVEAERRTKDCWLDTEVAKLAEKITGYSEYSLFISYLKDYYGIELIQEFVKSSQPPIEVIKEFSGLDFKQIYLNWITANVSNLGSKTDNPIYNYKPFDLDSKPVMIEVDGDYQKDLAIKDGGAEYIKLQGQKSDIQLSIDSQSDKLGIVKMIKDKE